MLAADAPPAAQPAPTAGAQPAELEEIVVTGQALPGSVIGNIPPENQLNPADIASYGVSTINDLLGEITEMTESDQGRGNTGPIILVNGKRVSGVNEVGDLPTESILRVDILPEEVALKYGYGAQQKVVNIILRRFFRAKVVNLEGGEPTAGAGESSTDDASYNRIRDNNRVSIVGRVKYQAAVRESDRGVSSTAGTVSDPAGTTGDDSDARTLAPATRAYSVNGVVAHQLSDAVSFSFNGQASYQTSRALDGYPSAGLDVPADSPYALSDEDAQIERYLSTDILHQDTDTAAAHAGVTLNADLPKKWRLSVIGAYDHSDARTGTDRGYDVSSLQTGIDAGGIDPYGSLSSATLGSLLRQDARALSNSGGVSALLNGGLWILPAGEITTSIKLGVDVSSLDSTSSAREATTSSRTQTNGQISIDVPLTSASKGVLGAVGDISVNVNGALTEVSGYGLLNTLGYGLHWSPTKTLSILATVNEDHQAPTLAQLNGPLITTSNIRVYDYVLGQTVTVNQIAGGNPDLKADDRHVFKLGASWAAITTDKTKLNLQANYLHSITRNAIGTTGSATVEAEAAFPDHFERDEDGTLESVDIRAVNFAREERESIRWGFNFTRVLRAPTRPAPPPGGRFRGPPGSPPGASGPPGATGAPPRGTLPEGGAPAAGVAQRPETGAPSGGPPPGDTEQVVVTAQRDRGGADSGPPPFGFPPDGGPPDGGPPDGPPPGPPPDGMGPPPGGGFGPPNFQGGGPRGGGPRGGGRGFGGAGNGAQFQLSLYHSWYFRDLVLLKTGTPAIDLLNGGTIGSGGQARHRVQMNAGVMDNGVGLRLSGNWTSSTLITGSADGSGPLYYGSLATFDVRLFADLQQRFRGKAWARGTRVTLAVSNVLDAHQQVHDGNGATPQIYQPAFLDPYGRIISLSFRRLF